MALPGQEPPLDTFDGAGLDLWFAVAGQFLLDDHERVLLAQACHVADDIAWMSETIDRQGLLLPWGRGVRAHPLIAHLNANRALLARLIASLHAPVSEEEAERSAEVKRRQFRAYRGGQA